MTTPTTEVTQMFAIAKTMPAPVKVISFCWKDAVNYPPRGSQRCATCRDPLSSAMPWATADVVDEGNQRPVDLCLRCAKKAEASMTEGLITDEGRRVVMFNRLYPVGTLVTVSRCGPIFEAKTTCAAFGPPSGIYVEGSGSWHALDNIFPIAAPPDNQEQKPGPTDAERHVATFNRLCPVGTTSWIVVGSKCWETQTTGKAQLIGSKSEPGVYVASPMEGEPGTWHSLADIYLVAAPQPEPDAVRFRLATLTDEIGAALGADGDNASALAADIVADAADLVRVCRSPDSDDTVGPAIGHLTVSTLRLAEYLSVDLEDEVGIALAELPQAKP